MSYSLAASYSFSTIEQLDEAMHAMNWATVYRQLKPGSFSSKFAVLESDSWFLMEEQSSHRVEVEAPAPAGMYMLALFEGNPATINGQTVSSDHIFVQGHHSDLRGTLPAYTKVTQLGIEAERFENFIQTVAPGLQIPSNRATVIATQPGILPGLRRAMRAALLAPSKRNATREESISGILANILTVADDHREPLVRHSLRHDKPQQALGRAMDFIEARLDRTIRVESVCRYAGTNLRSLERYFSRELGVSPQQYVKARRLNGVRRRLLAADGEQELSVTEAALSHGFVHLGRFAGHYRHHFGEYPRETLKRRRPTTA